jgi:hypothetical protein
MCACTKKAALHTPATAQPRRATPETWVGAHSALGGGSAIFEYVGRTAMTAIGRGTGRPYRFGTPGARVVADPRDRTSLAALPQLRLVRS